MNFNMRVPCSSAGANNNSNFKPLQGVVNPGDATAPYYIPWVPARGFPNEPGHSRKTTKRKSVMMNYVTMLSQSDAYKLMLREYPDVMNIEQMCEILNVSTKTGYGLIREGKVKCIKVGRAYRIPKVHLLTYLGIANYAERQS